MPTKKPKSRTKSLRRPKKLEAQKNLKKPSTGSVEYLQYNLNNTMISGNN